MNKLYWSTSLEAEALTLARTCPSPRSYPANRGAIYHKTIAAGYAN